MSHPDAFSLRRDFMLGKASAPVYALEDAAALSRCACAVAIGAFDGVHRGHRHLIDQMVADAHERGVAAIAVTFDPDPDAVVSAAPAPKLTLVADRLRLLASSGVDAVCVVPFDSALASLDHDAFFYARSSSGSRYSFSPCGVELPSGISWGFRCECYP